ncbi:fasciclin domain-containing protein [Pseudotamlana carrageenivorans]|uniref:FAS1 domain-containing protein n=1 Tax=Pseudotamlana carrageenivorans TaxID=2069432 RepID=A0A2I7SK57_9FLAO|nr:fasciclin domain-containing protein [Tamlana carrageenivorans]AUS06273.1 hypothetical protein C1A40_12820 [Tamlana carrageenivorans]
MNSKLKILKYTCIAFMSFLLVFSCNIPEDPEFYEPFVPSEVENPETISQIIIAREDFSIMESAMRLIEESGSVKIISELNVPGSSTVFVPNDEVFQAWLDMNGIDDLALLDVALIERVILNHILEGEFNSSNLVSGLTHSRALVGERGSEKNVSMYIDVSNGGVTVNAEASVITADVEANNGVIHVVNNVIELPVLLDFSVMVPSLTTFYDAVQYADTARDADGNGPNLMAKLIDSEAALTLLMPNNDAFTDLLVEQGVSNLTDLDPWFVADVISTQLINIAAISSQEMIDIGGPFALPASNNELLQIDPINLTVSDPNSRTANFIPGLIDITAVNGFVHTIDKVLLPMPTP